MEQLFRCGTVRLRPTLAVHIIRLDIMKFLIVLSVLVIGSAYVKGQFGDDHHHHYQDHYHLEEYKDYHAPPHYHWDYSVHDLHHHDIKSHHETRDHHETKGKYEFLQPDGRKRIVEYVAGKHGVDYKVRFEGHSHHGGLGGYDGYGR